MTSPASDLQKAIFSALSATPSLTALVGSRIVDHAPANVAFPYVSFGRASQFDWSTDTEGGCEQLLSIHCWSRTKGKNQVMDLMEAVRARLHDAALSLAGHTLVSLRFEAGDIRYDDDISAYQGALRFRAVTEPSS